MGLFYFFFGLFDRQWASSNGGKKRGKCLWATITNEIWASQPTYFIYIISQTTHTISSNLGL